MPTSLSAATAEIRIEDLLLNSVDITEFLDSFTGILADRLSDGGDRVWCAVSLLRDKRAATVASSGPQAEALDETQVSFDDGPCLTAIRQHEVTVVSEARDDGRWAPYLAVAAEQGVRSVLGVPFELRGEAAAALNVYSNTPHCFDDVERVARICSEVLQASNALLLGVRLWRQSELAADLHAAMASRTTIDLAVGIIMAQNRCGQARALEILKNASSHRNLKLHDLAGELVESIGRETVETHFDH
ncbi:RNA-binding protein [Pseudoclavibacter endophyticus]|uniref:GAF and ANTAR domain-containing protein n=1 Tax=Pseudoclavibacter endophyticus TaxID=1778590 RepID=A0A6H9WKQ1_9MICO|nr:GAF and ANTAR domain-containing protein [Pseudoclavibacter endophyticus]KAB1648339.1 GAF and ANTAR domain-containing protein [Pseudoclavibacter endophyticus]GGA71795.1 RNA-binding protein [Pseudoclavibacter endophyticus]